MPPKKQVDLCMMGFTSKVQRDTLHLPNPPHTNPHTQPLSSTKDTKTSLTKKRKIGMTSEEQPKSLPCNPTLLPVEWKNKGKAITC